MAVMYEMVLTAGNIEAMSVVVGAIFTASSGLSPYLILSWFLDNNIINIS